MIAIDSSLSYHQGPIVTLLGGKLTNVIGVCVMSMSVISFLLAAVSLPTVTGMNVHLNPLTPYLYVTLLPPLISSIPCVLKSSSLAIWRHNGIFGFDICIEYVSIHSFNDHHQRINNQSETNRKRSAFCCRFLCPLLFISIRLMF